MNKKAFTPLMIFGLIWLVLTLVSWFAFPDWQTIPGGFWTLAGVAALGVLAFLKDGVEYIKSFLEIGPKDEEKAASPAVEVNNVNAGQQTQTVSITIEQPQVPAQATPIDAAPSRSGAIPTGSAFTYIQRGIEGDVMDLLRSKQHAAVVGVSAPGGIGKSELAIQVSRELLRDGTFERSLWVDCGPKAAQDILMSMLRECKVNIPPNGTYDELVELLKGFLSEQNWLIILDDVRDANRAQINDLLPPESACAALLTSRIQQISTRVKMIPLEAMSNEQARLLLKNELNASLLRKEASAIHKLIERCKNNSLALMISARQIQMYENNGAKTPVALHLNKISENLKHLSIPESDPRFDLYAVFEASYTDLTPANQARFCALGVFDRSGFCLDAVAAVWGDDEENANAAIRSLLNRSLVKLVENINLERYQLHDLLDEYAESKLKQTGGGDATYERLSTWLIGLFEEHYTDDPDTAPEVTFELENLKRAIGWAAAAPLRGAWLAKLATKPRNWLYNYWREWEAWQSWLESSLRLGVEDQWLEANVLLEIGNVKQFRKEMDSALKNYNEALNLFRNTKDRLGEANSQKAMGDILQFQKEMDKALKNYNEALQLFQSARDPLGEANVLQAIGNVQHFRNNRDSAIECYNKALEILKSSINDLNKANNRQKSVKDRLGEAKVRKTIGDMQVFCDDRDSALKSYNEALYIFKDIGSRLGEAAVQKAIGDVHKFRKEMDVGLKSYKEALRLFKNASDRLGEANVQKAIGDVHKFRKEMNVALESYKEALRLFKAVGDRLGEANVLKAIGDIQQFRKEMPLALENYNEALYLFRNCTDRSGEANVLQAIGEIKLFHNDFDAALKNHNEALRLFKEVGSRLDEAYVLQAIGDVQQAIKEIDSALENYNKALHIFKSIGSRLGEANTLQTIGSVQQMFHKDRVTALKNYNEALHLYKIIDEGLGEANVMAALSRMAIERGEIEEAETQMAQITTMRRAIQSLYDEGIDYYNFANTLFTNGYKQKASQYAQKSRAIFEQLKMPQFMVRMDKIIAATEEDDEGAGLETSA